LRTTLRVLSLLVAAGALLVVSAPVSAANTNGARTFTISMSGPGGTGTAFVSLNPGGKVCYEIQVSLTNAGDFPQEPAPGLGNAHIHTFAGGGIAVHLESEFESLGGGTFVASRCVRSDKSVVRAILADPSGYYVNVHTVSFPDGAVMGALA
jgi:hypothetical protein